MAIEYGDYAGMLRGDQIRAISDSAGCPVLPRGETDIVYLVSGRSILTITGRIFSNCMDGGEFEKTGKHLNEDEYIISKAAIDASHNIHTNGCYFCAMFIIFQQDPPDSFSLIEAMLLDSVLGYYSESAEELEM